MFLFLLVTAELAILYAVYWYLFVRDANPTHRISAEDWGNYSQPGTTDGAHFNVLKKFMAPPKEELILDSRTNHYVPMPQKQGNWVSQLIKQLDENLSELNVKP